MKHFISLGAGVQSSTMALMAAHGEITPMPDGAIFSDTQAEPASVYRWLDWLKKQLPFPVHRVTAGSLTKKTLEETINRKTEKPYYSNMIPVFTLSHEGSIGRMQRHCTYNYKIIPIRKAVRKLAEIQRGQKNLGVIQWIGISHDEILRMKPCRDAWCEHRWPLIELRMTRNDCLLWMKNHGYPEPPRSACVYCPFHSAMEWNRLKNDEPEEFQEAVRVEKELQKLHASIDRNGAIKGTPFLHRSCRPLETIDFRSDLEKGQLSLWQEECEGMCGV